MKPIFIVGTGRCGSTMLSDLINQHPDILSLSEFFSHLTDLGGRIPELFTPKIMDGKEFWKIISAITPRQSLMLKHDVTTLEFLYPFKSPSTKYSAKTGIPAILHITLPHLTKDHDQVFIELRQYICQQGPSKIRTHFDQLFRWLMERFNKTVWVERSGGILFVIKELFQLYPEAHFIHIVRDGRNTALSMSKQFAFRIFLIANTLTQYLKVDPYESADRGHIEQVPKELQCFLPECFDRQAFLSYQPSYELCGQLWSKQIENALTALQHLDHQRLLTFSYEAFCETPEAHLTQLVDFIGVDSDPQWITETAKIVKMSSSKWLNLREEQKLPLEKACEPGMALIKKFLP